MIGIYLFILFIYYFIRVIDIELCSNIINIFIAKHNESIFKIDRNILIQLAFLQSVIIIYYLFIFI
jgi:hypothetical protein